MDKKISIKIIMIMVTAAVLTVPSSVIQSSHAQSNGDIQNTVLKIHNDERAAVKVPPLTWSSSLAAEAQAYANQLTSGGHVCNAQQCPPVPHGARNENLAQSSPGYKTVAQMVQGWADEKSGYTLRPTPSGYDPAGHYTAMVWQDTKEVGCGISNSAQIDVLVCRYSPQGNLVGQMPFGRGAAQAVGEEDAGVPPIDEAVGNEDDGGGEEGGGEEGGGEEGGGEEGGGEEGGGEEN